MDVGIIEKIKSENRDIILSGNVNDDSTVLKFFKETLDYIAQLLKAGAKNFIEIFNNYNIIDFTLYFYIGYILGVLLGKFFHLLGGRYGLTGYFVFAFFYYFLFIDCFIVIKHPIALGIGTSFTILTIMNLLQKPHGITYKEVALIFPIFKYIISSLSISETQQINFGEYDKQKLEDLFKKEEIEKKKLKEIFKQKQKQKIENKINEILKKLEDF